MINEVMITYFYQIRFFTPNMVPISTAIWDPPYFHGSRTRPFDKNKVFKDKNGVYNGIRCNALCDLLVRPEMERVTCGQWLCDHRGNDCPFLRTYRRLLDEVDFESFMTDLERLLGKIVQLNNSAQNFSPVPVFIVYEKPDNPCSERGPLKDWFESHGVKVTEFQRSV